MKFSEKLLQLRKKAGMSQEDLAEKLEVSRQAISRWELGTATPDAPNLIGISSLFGVSIDYLLHDDYKSDDDIPSVKEVTSKMKKRDKKHHKLYLVTSVLMYFGAICFLVACSLSNNYLFLVAGILYVISASGFLYNYFKSKPSNANKENKN